ncbi:MAG: hypothetical protein ACE5HT_15195, partial [Gemmatimonadales bacterium]
QLVTTASTGASVTVQIPVGGAQSASNVATGGVAFDPLTSGSATVSATIPGIVAQTTATRTVTVTAPGINLSGTTVGAGLQRSWFGSLGASNHGGVTVRVESPNPQVLLISPNATTAGTAFVDIPVANGQTSFSFYVQGVEGQTGSVSVTASAPGFTSRSAAYAVVQPGLDISGLSLSTTTLSPDDGFVVRIGLPNGANTGLTQLQNIRAGGTALTATVVTSAPGVGQLVTTASTGASVTVQIPVGGAQSASNVATGGVAFRPLAVGSTVVSATIPGVIATTSGASKTVSVQP